MQTLIKKKTP